MQKQKRDTIVARAKSLIGKPYKYGAKPEDAPKFFDCSSFTQYVFKQAGIALPRSTILQAECGAPVHGVKDLHAGDLLFFHGTQGFYNKKFPQGIGHVVLYVGGGKTIHAASKRVQKKPVIEKGCVEERTLTYVIKKCGPLTAIKRL